jgi:acetyl esterase
MAGPDYLQLLDAQMRNFVKETELAFPSDATSISIEEQRRLYDSMSLKFRHAFPDGVSKKDRLVTASADEEDQYRCRIRVYENKQALDNPSETVQVVYFHGGGFIVGGLESHDDVCAEICLHTGLTTTSVDYRLLPEHPHPAALNDCLSAIVENYKRCGQPIVLCGDSAGANLCAAASHNLRKSNVGIVGQLLIYPGLGADMTQGSYVEHANAPLLTTADVIYYANLRALDESQRHDPLIAPLCDTDFSNLSPTLIITADCDPLRDDGRLYRDAIEAAGGQAEWINEPGLVHGYLRARHTVARARDSFDRILSGIKRLASSSLNYS